MITTTDVIKLLGNAIGDKIEVNVSQIIYSINFRSIFSKCSHQTSKSLSAQFLNLLKLRTNRIKEKPSLDI